MVTRWLRHQFAAPVRRVFDAAAMERIRSAIQASEQRHRAEVCFAVERALSWSQLVARQTPRERSEEVFAELKVWDTAGNNGVLLYLLRADRAMEIVADRAVVQRVPGDGWSEVCARLADDCAAGREVDGVIHAIEALTTLLERAFPCAADDPPPGELRDVPTVL